MCGCSIESFHKGLKATSAIYFIIGIILFAFGVVVERKVLGAGIWAYLTGFWICITIQFSAWSNKHVCLQITALVLNIIGVIILLTSTLAASNTLTTVKSLEACVYGEREMNYGNKDYYVYSIYCYTEDDRHDCSCADRLTDSDSDATDVDTFNCVYFDLPNGSQDCGRLFSDELLSDLKVISGFASAALCCAVALSFMACAPVCCRTSGQCFDNSMVQVVPLNAGPGPRYVPTTAIVTTTTAAGGGGGGSGDSNGSAGEHVHQAEVVDVTASVVVMMPVAGEPTDNYKYNSSGHNGYVGVPIHTYEAVDGGGDGGSSSSSNQRRSNTTGSYSQQQQTSSKSKEDIVVVATATPVSSGYNGSMTTTTSNNYNSNNANQYRDQPREVTSSPSAAIGAPLQEQQQQQQQQRQPHDYATVTLS